MFETRSRCALHVHVSGICMGGMDEMSVEDEGIAMTLPPAVCS
jgi:hypothetical protein